MTQIEEKYTMSRSTYKNIGNSSKEILEKVNKPSRQINNLHVINFVFCTETK